MNIPKFAFNKKGYAKMLKIRQEDGTYNTKILNDKIRQYNVAAGRYNEAKHERNARDIETWRHMLESEYQTVLKARAIIQKADVPSALLEERI